MSNDKKKEDDKHTRESVQCSVDGRWQGKGETLDRNRIEMSEKGS
jgi:hypothetical protein